MSSASMSITEDEFNREVEALKSHRRHSVNRPVLDPDLPDLAAIYGGGQELLVLTSPERERRGYNLVDDGQVATRSPSSFSGAADQQALNGGRSQFTARRKARGSPRATGSDAGVTHSSYSQRQSSDPSDLPGLSPSASSSSSGRRSPNAASLSPKDPSHLFWVPASVHPEISPSDFRNFLREHAARAVSQHAGDEGEVPTDDILPSMAAHDSPIAQRLNSVRQQQDGHDFHSGLVSRATSLSRRGSTLRRQYRPENDNDDLQEDRPLQRNRSQLGVSASPNVGIPNLTIGDLQRLEAAAEEASQTQNPAMLRSVLRRTLSTSAPNDFDTIDDVPAEPTQDPDAPIIVPKPGQILRRAARTKIRKASGDSTPRASLASRRRGTTGGELESATEGGRAWELRRNSAEEMERRHSGQSEVSSGAEDESSLGHGSSRPTSAEAAESLADNHSRDSYHSDISQRTSVTSYADTISDSGGQLVDEGVSSRRTPTQDTIVAKGSPYGYFDIEDPSTSQPDLHNRTSSAGALVVSPQYSPVEERGGIVPTTAPPAVSVPPIQTQRRAQPSSVDPHASLKDDKTAAPVPPAATHVPVVQQQPLALTPKHKEKDKRSGFGLSWFGLGKDEDEEKAKADKGILRKKEKHEKRERKEREKEEKEREDSTSSSFLGALFGKKKGADESATGTGHRPMQGQLTVGSLLERNEMALKGKNGFFYSRYPIHVERAVYRLSHIKLANPRRPLYEQVLISNLMFWYLSIINRNNQEQTPQQQQQQQQSVEDKPLAHQSSVQNQPSASNSSPVIDTSSAYDGIEPIYEGDDSSAVDQRSQNGGSGTSPPNTAVKPKRTGLVKPNRAPAGSNRGRAETPMKQPGYGKQHRQIDDDFRMGAPSSSSGFVVGQVVDAQAMQANTPYRAGPEFREGPDRQDQARSAATDYLGLGTHFGTSEPLWSDPVNLAEEHANSFADVKPSAMAEAESDPSEIHRRRSGAAPSSGGLQRSSSPNKPYRAEAEKERAWLGVRSGSGRSSPNGASGTYTHRVEVDDAAPIAMNGSDRMGSEPHPQGRSTSLSGTTPRSSSDLWRSGSDVERRRKVSAGSLSHSTSAHTVSPSVFDRIDEKAGLPTSSSTPAMDGYTHQQYQQRSPNREGGSPNGHASFPIAPGSNAMLEAARTSQSRRR